MSAPLRERCVLVIGGSSGIGLAAAEQFAAEGAQVLIAGRDAARGEQVLQRLGAAAGFVACDVADEASVARLFEQVAARFGRLDVAVNAAAVAAPVGLLHERSAAEAATLLDTDVLGQFLCMKQEIALMLAGGGGAIVNVASVNGLAGAAMAALYSAGRHAVVGLTRSAAREYIGAGIRINAVCPGPTDTPRRAARLAGLAAEQRQAVEAQTAQAIPIGRLAGAAEVAQAIVWLASPAASYVVGHCLVVDGGLSA